MFCHFRLVSLSLVTPFPQIKAQAEFFVEKFPKRVSESQWELARLEAQKEGFGSGMVPRNSFKRSLLHFMECPFAPSTVRDEARNFRNILIVKNTAFIPNTSCEFCKGHAGEGIHLLHPVDQLYSYSAPFLDLF